MKNRKICPRWFLDKSIEMWSELPWPPHLTLRIGCTKDEGKTDMVLRVLRISTDSNAHTQGRILSLSKVWEMREILIGLLN